MKIEQTFIIIKPDAIDRSIVGRIISRFEDKFFDIIRVESRQKNLSWMKLFYSHVYNSDRDIFWKLCDFMADTMLIGIILEGPDAINTVRKMVGSTNSLSADPGTIRGDFGSYPIRYNCVHASDSVESARKEIALFFNDPEEYCHKSVEWLEEKHESF